MIHLRSIQNQILVPGEEGGGGEGTGGNKWQDMQMKPQFNTSKKYFSGKNKAQNIKHLK